MIAPKKEQEIHWLMISSIPPGNTGGAEIHMKRLLEAFAGMGNVHASYLKAPSPDLPCDVIHTHGSLFRPALIAPILRKKNPPLWIHTAHGFTFDRMKACREWTWLGGYQAALREQYALDRADLVALVHPGLSNSPLLRLRKWRGKKIFVCGNGYDSQPIEIAEDAISRRWIYVGRIFDVVKNGKLLYEILEAALQLEIDLVPGDQTRSHARVFPAGVLSHEETQRKISRSAGLLLTSKYEGLPLVVLEALGQGVPVVCTKVGGLSTLPEGIRGLTFCEPRAQAFAEAVEMSPLSPLPIRLENAALNRQRLDTWSDVALRLVQHARDSLGI